MTQYVSCAHITAGAAVAGTVRGSLGAGPTAHDRFGPQIDTDIAMHCCAACYGLVTQPRRSDYSIGSATGRDGAV